MKSESGFCEKKVCFVQNIVRILPQKVNFIYFE